MGFSRLTYVFIFVSLAILIGIFWWQRTTYDITNIPVKNDTIVAFGDSLVFGIGATKGNDFVSVLSEKVDRPIINLGIPGDATEDGRKRINEILVHDPGIVIIVLGGNDALRRVPREETERNLREIITTLQNNGSVVALAAVRGGLLGDPYQNMYESVARETGAILISDIFDELFGNSEFMDDQIHPNDAGYAIVAERIHKAIVPYLSQ